MGSIPGVGVVGEPRSASYQKGQIFNRPVRTDLLYLVFTVTFESISLPFMQASKEFKIEPAPQYASFAPAFDSFVANGQLYPMPGASQIVLKGGSSLSPEVVTKIRGGNSQIHLIGFQLSELLDQAGSFPPAGATFRFNSLEVVYDSQSSATAVPPMPVADSTQVTAHLAMGVDSPALNLLGNTRIEKFWSVGASSGLGLDNLYTCQYVSSCYFDLDLENPENSLGFRRDQDVGGALAGQQFRTITPGLVYNSLGQIS